MNLWEIDKIIEGIPTNIILQWGGIAKDSNAATFFFSGSHK